MRWVLILVVILVSAATWLAVTGGEARREPVPLSMGGAWNHPPAARAPVQPSGKGPASGSSATTSDAAPPMDKATLSRRSALLAQVHSDGLRQRQMALAGLTSMATSDPVAMETLLRAATDPEPKIRRSAVSALGGICGRSEPARETVLRALGDKDQRVRETAVSFLRNLGQDGGRRSLDALFERTWSEDAQDELCSHVVEYGLIVEALDRGASRTMRASLLRHLCFEVSNDHPGYARSLRGRYREFVADFIPDGTYGWREYFETAETGGDVHLARDVALDRKRPDATRAGAIAAAIRREDRGREFLDLAGRVLAEPGASVELRLMIVEHIDTFRAAHPRQKEQVLELLRELARTDASPAVRKAAREGCY